MGLNPEENAKDNIIFSTSQRNPTLSVAKDFGNAIFEHIKGLTNNFTKIL